MSTDAASVSLWPGGVLGCEEAILGPFAHVEDRRIMVCKEREKMQSFIDAVLDSGDVCLEARLSFPEEGSDEEHDSGPKSATAIGSICLWLASVPDDFGAPEGCEFLERLLYALPVLLELQEQGAPLQFSRVEAEGERAYTILVRRLMVSNPRYEFYVSDNPLAAADEEARQCLEAARTLLAPDRQEYHRKRKCQLTTLARILSGTCGLLGGRQLPLAIAELISWMALTVQPKLLHLRLTAGKLPDGRMFEEHYQRRTQIDLAIAALAHPLLPLICD